MLCHKFPEDMMYVQLLHCHLCLSLPNI